MKSVLLNLALAAIWWLLSGQPSTAQFVVGWGVGFCLIALARRILRSEAYVRRSIAFAWFAVSFVGVFLAANVSVVWIVVTRPRRCLFPDYITYDIRGLQPHETILLSLFTSLTPGTTAVRIDDERKELILHALDAREPDQVRTWMDEHIRRRILAFTR